MYSEPIKRLRDKSLVISHVERDKIADALEEQDDVIKQLTDKGVAGFEAMQRGLASRDRVIQQYAAAIKYAQQATCLAADADPDSPIGKLYAEVSKCESIQPTTSALDAYVAGKVAAAKAEEVLEQVRHFKRVRGERDALAEKVKEKDAEIDRLVLAIADHVTVRSEQHAEISKQADALKLAKEALLAYPIRGEHFMENLVATELATKAIAAINALEGK